MYAVAAVVVGVTNLASVTVTILNSETGDSETTTTEADGYYSFSDVNSGDYLVRFSKSGYLSQLESWEISEGGSMADVTMTEAPSGSGNSLTATSIVGFGPTKARSSSGVSILSAI